MQKLRKPIGFIAAVALATAGLVPLVGSSVFAHADPITAEYNGTIFTNDTQSKDRERRNESNNNGQFVNGDGSYLPEFNLLTNTANDTTCLRTHDPHTPLRMIGLHMAEELHAERSDERGWLSNWSAGHKR